MKIPAPEVIAGAKAYIGDTTGKWCAHLSQLNVCQQKAWWNALISTIGAGTVLMPYGGKRQLFPVPG